MKQITKFQGNQVDLCQGNTCVKTRGPVADALSIILVFTAIITSLTIISKMLK